MGIDKYTRGSTKTKSRKEPKSENLYLQLLHKLYSFLARRTDSDFNKKVAKRLAMSRVNKAPLSTKHLAKYMRGRLDKTCVVVGPVLDDPRLVEVPEGLKVVALKFSDTARTRIIASGGACLTFDEFAQQNPLGVDTVLLRGKKTARKANKHFGGPPGAKGSKARPYVRSKGRKFEKARGRRKSRGFKV